MLFSSTWTIIRYTFPVFRVLIYVTPTAYIPFDIYWVYRPGPIIYYNHFIALILMACLLFTATQLFLLERKVTTYNHSRWRRRLIKSYWGAIFASSSLTLVFWKLDCVCISALNIIACGLAFRQLYMLSKVRQASFRPIASAETYLPATIVEPNQFQIQEDGKQDSVLKLLEKISASQSPPLLRSTLSSEIFGPSPSSDDDIPWWKSTAKFQWAMLHVARPLRVLHIMVVALNVTGAIKLGLRSHYDNLGHAVTVDIPGIGARNVNIYCTISSIQVLQNKPTIWLEGSSSQGITDFLGIQHYLTADHDLPSCSYDPPSFGGSDPLPNKLGDHTAWLPALLKALNGSVLYGYYTGGETRTYVGWGSSGLQLAVQHAIADESATSVIALDPQPDGVEYFVEQMAHNWTQKERLQYRKNDLATKVLQQRLILSFGLGWGLLPFFRSAAIPELKSYYPTDDLSTYRAQKWRDPILARQYYELLASAATWKEDQCLNNTRLPERVKLHGIINPKVVQDLSRNDYYRRLEINVLNALGGNNIGPIQWCWEADCTENFPVEKARFTAGAIARVLGF